MRILIDGVVFENTRQRGVQRYARELLRRVGKQCEVEIWLEKPAVTELPANCTVCHGFPRTWGHSLPARVRWKWRVARHHKAWQACNVFHTTYLSTPPIAGLASVLTVHDVIPQRFPDMCERWGDGQAKDFDQAVSRGDAFIAVSQATADEFLALYPKASGRVTVIHHGVDHLLDQGSTSATLPDAIRQKDFALYVGDRGSYKNFRSLLEAMTAPEFPRQLYLAVAGPQWRLTEELLMRGLGVAQRVIHCGRVTDAVLGELYRQCKFAVVPALIEGFGFPVLEAQSAGAAVACSDIPVFRELMGASAAFFDPRLPASIAATAAALLDEALARPLRQAGGDNVRRYTWDKCAARTLEVYAKLAGK